MVTESTTIGELTKLLEARYRQGYSISVHRLPCTSGWCAWVTDGEEVEGETLFEALSALLETMPVTR